MTSAKLTAAVASKISAMFAWVGALPIVGKIAFAILAISAVAFAATIVAAAFQNKGLTIGVEIKYTPRGFLGLFGKWSSNLVFDMS